MIRAPFSRLVGAAALSFALLAGPLPDALAQSAATEPAASQPPKARARTPVAPKAPADAKAATETGKGKGAKGDKPSAETGKKGGKADKATPETGRGKAAGKADAPEKGKADKGAKAAAKKGAAAPPGLKGNLLATFGQWSVFAAGEGKERLCYAISRPQQRTPKTVPAQGAFLFVTVRKPKNEIAIIMGFPVGVQGGPKLASATGGAGSKTASVTRGAQQLVVGNAKFPLVGKDKNAWVKDQDEEPKVIREMGKAAKLTVQVLSAKAEEVSDEYSLAGFPEAFKRTREECK